MDYTLIRSNRRSIAIEITREAKLVVRAPNRCAKRDIDAFVLSRREWIEKHLELMRDRLENHPEPDESREKELRSMAKAVIPARVEYFSKLMGLYPQAVTITSARTRFGSCSGTNRLSFSWRLMDYPPEAVDYVVVHELCHIVHKNHSAQFYALVASVLPDWKIRREMLKK